jgi:hypothetical protein
MMIVIIGTGEEESRLVFAYCSHKLVMFCTSMCVISATRHVCVNEKNNIALGGISKL